MSMERRFFSEPVAVGKDAEGRTYAEGYAAVFGARSEDLGGFVEVVERGAFDGVLSNPATDVRAYLNHEPSLILGRQSSKTLQLAVDDKGLRYRALLPDTTYARDLAVVMERGDVRESSFAFNVAQDGGDTWEERDGVIIRRVRAVNRLYDVSVVALPAYPATDAAVAQRSFKHWRENHAQAPRLASARRRTRLLALEG